MDIDSAEALRSLAFEAHAYTQARRADAAPEREWPGIKCEFRRRALDVIAHTLNNAEAMEFVGYSRSTLYEYWLKDETFRAAYEQARALAADHLESIAFQEATGRAVPKFHEGVLCGAVLQRDNGLLKWLLANHKRKEYDPRHGLGQDDQATGRRPIVVELGPEDEDENSRVQLAAPVEDQAE